MEVKYPYPYIVQLFFTREKTTIYGEVKEYISKPVYSYIIRSKKTLDYVQEFARRYGLITLYLPQPVKITKNLWMTLASMLKSTREKYGELKTGHKFATFTKFINNKGLLGDQNIKHINVLIIDVDSPFEHVLPVWLWIEDKLGIKTTLYKTKSGRFRAIIHIKPNRFNITKKHKNHITHKQNAQAIISIIGSIIEHYNLSFDRSTSLRLNHPLVVENEPIGEGYKLYRLSDEMYQFYDLYGRVRELQKDLNIYTDLTRRYVSNKPLTVNEKTFIKIPSFIKRTKSRYRNLTPESNTMTTIDQYTRAVNTLARKHKSGRFIHVMMPAVGWAKYLNLDMGFVRELLRSLMGDKKDFDRDFNKAVKYAHELQFGDDRRSLEEEKQPTTAYLEDYIKKAITFLKLHKRATRQQLIKQVFNGQEWLTDGIMGYLLQQEVVSKEVEKHGKGKAGRPMHVFYFKKDLVEENRMLLPPREEIEKMYEKEVKEILDNKQLPTITKENTFRRKLHATNTNQSYTISLVDLLIAITNKRKKVDISTYMVRIEGLDGWYFKIKRLLGYNDTSHQDNKNLS